MSKPTAAPWASRTCLEAGACSQSAFRFAPCSNTERVRLSLPPAGLAVKQTSRRRVGSPEHAAAVVDVGKTGEGAGSAMAQIARDRVITAARATTHTAEDQIRAL